MDLLFQKKQRIFLPIRRVQPSWRIFLGSDDNKKWYLISYWTYSKKSSSFDIFLRASSPWKWYGNWSGNWNFASVGAHSMRACGPSTLITKLLSAFTGHSWTPFISLYPIIATGALFKLGSFDKVYKVLVIFVKSIINLIFSTSHACVIVASTPQTIMFWAGGTAVVV